MKRLELPAEIEARSAFGASPVNENVPASRRWMTTPLMAGLVAIVFTLLCLQWSFARGRLSQDSTYDDTGYLIDGARRLATFYDAGAGAFLRDLVSNPPHSAFSTLGATLAFAIFGVNDWAPYAFNGIIAFTLLVFVGHLARGMSPPLRLAAMILSLTLPLSVVAVHDFRPDLACGLMTAIGFYLVVDTAAGRTGPDRRRGLLLGGVSFGAALLIKPSFFPHTLAMEAIAIAGGALLAWRAAEVPGRALPTLFREGLWIATRVVVPCLLVALPYYILNVRHTVSYFFAHTSGEHGRVWRLPGGWWGSAEFFTVGAAGRNMLGTGFVILLAAWLLALVWILARRRWKEAATQGIMLIGATASLGAVISGRMSNEFFALSCQILLLFICLRAVIFVLSSLPQTQLHPALAGTVLVGLAAACLGQLDLQQVWKHGSIPLNALVGRGNSLNQRIVDDVETKIGRRGALMTQAPLLFSTVAGFVNTSAMQWTAIRDKRRLLTKDIHLDDRIENYRREIAGATFILGAEDETDGVFHSLPSWERRFEIAALLADEVKAGRLKLWRSYPTARGAYLLYINEAKLLQVYGAFDASLGWEGFLPWEFPSMQSIPGQIRWALAPRARVTFNANAIGQARLNFSVLTYQPAQTLVVVNGTTVADLDIRRTEGFRDFSLPVELKAGANEVEFRFVNDLTPDADGQRRALLFRQFEVQPSITP